MTVYRYQADSWDDFLNDLRNKPINKAFHGKDESRTGSESFTGSRSFEHSMELAEQGCSKTREAIHEASFRVVTDSLPEWEFSPVGAFPCIPAYAAGVPENMFTQSEWGTPIPKPIVRIVVNIGANCNVTTQEIINRGAAVLALIDRVQAAGQRVELVAEWSTTRERNWYIFSVTVKRPEEPADLDRISYAMAHPSMLRRSGFRAMEFTAPHYVGGYGSSRDYPERGDTGEVYIGSMSSDGHSYESRESARAKINGIWDKAAQAA